MVKSLAVGKAIKGIRLGLLAKNSKWTQEHVAHESSVSLRHYQKIEAGTVDVKLSTLFGIANVLGATPQEVLDGAVEMQRGSKARKR